MAPASSDRGTSSGTIACQAGLFIAAPTFSSSVRPSSMTGPIAPPRVNTLRSTAAASIHVCQKIRSRRRSRMSAVAPATSPSASTGRLAAVCISAMRNGDPVSTVISQVAAVSCIHVPVFDATDASHRLRNSG